MLVATIEGIPAGLALDEETIAADLTRRQQGYGRGGRMKIEADRARIVAGVRHGRTLGGPIALLIENRDHANWSTRMQVAPLRPGQDAGARVVLPRPGHADLAGAFKYGPDDLRDVLERASARETAARVALGAIAKALLASVDVFVGSCVTSIHGARARSTLDALPESRVDARALNRSADASEVRALDAADAMKAEIDQARKRRDTVGGTFEIVATGVPPGLGSYGQWDTRLDARLVRAVTSIPAVKAAEVGDGWVSADCYGSEVHDPIVRSGPALVRPTNHAGGTEGGVSNGQPVVVRGAMKPIATVSAALPSVNLETGEADRAHVERSDTCAVPAAAVVGESMVALALAEALLEAVPGHRVEDVQAGVRAAWRRSRRLPGHVWLTGLPGAGKSTVGPLLAAALGLRFVDVDEVVVSEGGRSIPELFEVEGEDGFRARERDVIRRLAAGDRAVIATGGGALQSVATRDLCKRSGEVVWLRVDVGVAVSRIGSGIGRPLFATGDAAAVMSALEIRREPDFGRIADVRVEADVAPSRVVDRIVGALGSLG